MFLLSHFFPLSEERKGEAPWCSLARWMCLADVKSYWPFWSIFGAVVLTWDHRHCKKKACDSLPWAEFPAFAISVYFEAAIKPSSLCLILQTLVLEICHDDIIIAIRFSFFFIWSQELISVLRNTSVCARPWGWFPAEWCDSWKLECVRQLWACLFFEWKKKNNCGIVHIFKLELLFVFVFFF